MKEAPVKTKPNQSQLKLARIVIYKKTTRGRGETKGINGESFHIPETLASRQKNFKIFVKENFFLKDDNSWEPFQWPAGVINKLPVYQKLKFYSETAYGAAMIYRVLADNKKRRMLNLPLFKVMYDDGYPDQGASAGLNSIKLAKDFPNSLPFPGGERKYYPAIIHHEMGHTRFFRKNTTDKTIMTLLDERQVVIHLENPIRMRKGFEPRYTYKRGARTINIITGDFHVTGFDTVSESDPRIPMKVGAKGAYRK